MIDVFLEHDLIGCIANDTCKNQAPPCPAARLSRPFLFDPGHVELHVQVLHDCEILQYSFVAAGLKMLPGIVNGKCLLQGKVYFTIMLAVKGT